MRNLVATVTVIASIGCSHAQPSAMPSRPTGLLAAPRLVAPQEGAVLTFTPRTIDFEWSAVAGAARYVVEVDCYMCCAPERWCSDVGPNRTTRHEVAGTAFTSSEFPGNQPGRWRVWGIDAGGRAGSAAAWREFTFHNQPAPPPAGSSFRTPAGVMISGPGVVGPKATYNPNPVYPPSASKDRVTGQVMMEAVVDENGRIQNVRVVRSLRTDLDEAAVATFRRWRFEPARQDGQPRAALINVEMSFNMK